jgi:steroid delta-isomerase-like uncharacterized protein
MEEDPKTLVRRIYEEIVNQGNMAVAEEILAPDFVEHIPIPVPGQPARGPEALTWFITAFRTAFPDLHVTVEQMMAEEAFVAARITWQGTHQGEFMGISPTGKRVQVTGIDICRVAHGQVQEHWGQLDVVSFLQQLHLMPEPLGTPIWG